MRTEQLFYSFPIWPLGEDFLPAKSFTPLGIALSRNLKTVDTFKLSYGRVYSLSKDYHLSMPLTKFGHSLPNIPFLDAGLGGSIGCAVRLETRMSRVQPPPRSATFFRGD